MRLADLADRRVAVWGYGREGRAALAALHAFAPSLRPTLFCNAAEAAEAATDARVRVVVQAPDAAALSAFDVVIKSPGIGAYRPEILEARHNGTQFTSGTALWFAEHPEAHVIAVTGTKGKSTVTALVAHLLRALGRRVALAGNIGMPLLELVDPPQPPDWWAIELSSFQTREAPSVAVGVINNLHEEHLDWHGSRERYVEDKLALAAAARQLLVSAQQPELLARTATHPRRRLFGAIDGWHVADGAIHRGPLRVFELERSPLPGAHNASNLCAALAALEAAGKDAIAAAPAIASFRPLPHRLQPLGHAAGLDWIDDSIATTPAATLEALVTLAGREVCVLVGGHDRGLDWHAFAEAVSRHPPCAIVAMGANGARIANVLRESGGAYRLAQASTLADAVARAREATPPGGVVLLSPGAPSFDQFRDYVERGRVFARLAGFDPQAIGMEGLGIA